MYSSVVSPTQRWFGLRLELAVENVRRHRLVAVAHRRALVAMALGRHQAVELHQPHNSFPAHPHAVLRQLAVHTRAAVASATALVGLTHQHAEMIVLARVLRRRPVAPGVDARQRDE
jgi:hypothetical protein